MRLLATHHIFVEVSPDVFTNNGLSSVLDTGKSVEALFTQYVETSQRIVVEVNIPVDQS